MPDNTDIYGFTYPCPGEAITPAAISLLTGQIDAKLADVDDDAFYMINRYNATVTGTAQNILQGVETVLANPSYVFPVAGVWQAAAEVFPAGGPAAVNSFRTRLRHNAATGFGITINTENFILDASRPARPFVVAAGDTLTIAAFYSGTVGSNMNVTGRLAVKLVCRIA